MRIPLKNGLFKLGDRGVIVGTQNCAELYTKGILKGKTMRAGVENLLPVDEALNYIPSPAHIHVETLESTSGVPADQSTSEWVTTVHCVLMKHYAGIFL